ncbi:MAG: hypothetical protein LBC53_02515 [Spirochaetaceae bacterium]|jgi:hypothetical protein|nr:hypothetical protein [Spirochaetaceae bacterium]
MMIVKLIDGILGCSNDDSGGANAFFMAAKRTTERSGQTLNRAPSPPGEGPGGENELHP